MPAEGGDAGATPGPRTTSAEGCILSPCLLNFHAEDIMRNAGLEEAQAGIKIAGRNFNNLRYADDTKKVKRSYKAS